MGRHHRDAVYDQPDPYGPYSGSDSSDFESPVSLFRHSDGPVHPYQGGSKDLYALAAQYQDPTSILPRLRDPFPHLRTAHVYPRLSSPTSATSSSDDGPSAVARYQHPFALRSDGYIALDAADSRMPMGLPSMLATRVDVPGTLGPYPAFDHPHRLGLTLDDIRHPRALSPPPSDESHKRLPLPSSSVVIACRPCRGRKIRCDSNRPRCNNCVRRKNECIYDAVPKRRGPDKRPGTRQRSCKKRPSSASTPPKEKRDELAPPATDEDAAPTAKRRRVGTPVPCDELLTSPRPPTPAATSPSPAGKEKPQQTRRRASNASSSSSTREPERSAASAAPLPLRITTDFLIPSVSSRSNESTATPPNLFTSPSPRRPLAGVFMNVNVNAQSPTRGYSTPVVSPLLIESSPPSRKQMVAGPGSVSADQKAWWAGFLAEYALNNVISDLTFLFGDTGHLLSFLNLSALLQVLWSAEDRVRLPPAFVLAGLALAELMRSSEGERGAAGRARAAQWRQSAQTRLEFAISEGGSVDYRLAEAALILVVYETCAHPTYHPDRVGAALLVLDNLLNQLDLAQLDAHDPSAARFTPHSVPVVHVPPPPVLNPPPPIPQRPYALSQQPQYPTPRRTCRCSSVPGSPPPDNTVFCVSPPRWNPGWSAAETRAEECRRLVWCSLGAASGFMVQCAAFDAEAPVLRMLSDNSYALLFPGEFVDRLSSAFGGSDALSPKESLWALYCRSLLLWNFAHRLATAVRESPHALDPESDALHETWSEAAAIQESLELHVCNYDTGITYLCQEFVHNTRTSITQALRRINGFARELSTTPGPLFNRKQAVEWVEYQTHVVKRVKLALYQLGRRAPHIQQNALTRRPYLVGWFLNQFSVCMQIWTHDTELADAVALGKDLLAIMDVLNSWWPSDHNHAHTERLRKQLCHACAVVGAELPPYPTNTDLTLVRL